MMSEYRGKARKRRKSFTRDTIRHMPLKRKLITVGPDAEEVFE